MSVQAKVLAGLMLVLWLAEGGSADPPPATRQVTLEDILSLEGFGTALFDPSGQRLVYEKLRPYDQNTDFSFRSYAYAKSGHQVWVYDLGRPDGPALLQGIDPQAHTYLLSFSPSGRYLAYFQYRFGALSLAAYDFETGRAAEFDPAPIISRGGEDVPVWTSDDHLVYAALPDGTWPVETSLRARIGRELTQAWQDAWAGAVPTAREVRTRSEIGSTGRSGGWLVRGHAATGQVQRLAEGRYSGLVLAPDGARIAGLRTAAAEGGATRAHGIPAAASLQLVTVDLMTGAEHVLAAPIGFSAGSIAWHPSGRRLAAFGWHADEDASGSGRFYDIDPESGEWRPFNTDGLSLVSERERGWLDRPERAVFLGDRLAVFARPYAGEGSARWRERADWYSLVPDGRPQKISSGGPAPQGTVLHSGAGHITLISGDAVERYHADRRHVRLTPVLQAPLRHRPAGTLAARPGLARSPFSDFAVFDVEKSGHRAALILDLRDGHDGEAVSVELDAGATTLAASLRSGAVASLVSEGNVTNLLVSTEHGRLRIASANQHMADTAPASWRTVEYSVSLPGQVASLQSCVLLPAGFSPAQPPPLVIDIYPGAGADCLDSNRRPAAYPDPNSAHVWSSRGYAYARLSLPASQLGDATGPFGNLAALADAGADALVAEGYADPERMILHGFSMGGVTALYLAAQSPRYRAVIAKHSWANLLSHYFGTPGAISLIDDGYFGSFARYESAGIFGIGATVFDAAHIYLLNSPVFLAPRIDMPVMLIGSDLDTFDLGQFDEMYGALLRAGKDAVYVRYLGEGHGLSSPANIRDMWERTDQFLEARGLSP